MHSEQSEESLSAGDASLTITITDFISNFNRDEGIILKNLPDGLLNDGQQQIKHKIIENDMQKEAKFISNKVDKTLKESIAQLDDVEKSLESNRSVFDDLGNHRKDTL